MISITNILYESKNIILNRIKKFFNSISINYGFVGDDNKIYDISKYSDTDFTRLFCEHYQLQSPESVKKSGVGVCWDLVEYERDFFKKNNIPHSCYYIELKNKIKDSHTFLVFKDCEKYYWFEYAFYDHRGIHGPFETIDKIIKTVSNHIKNGRNIKHDIYMYDSPKYGSSINEFINYIYKYGKKYDCFS